MGRLTLAMSRTSSDKIREEVNIGKRTASFRGTRGIREIIHL